MEIRYRGARNIILTMGCVSSLVIEHGRLIAQGDKLKTWGVMHVSRERRAMGDFLSLAPSASKKSIIFTESRPSHSLVHNGSTFQS